MTTDYKLKQKADKERGKLRGYRALVENNLVRLPSGSMYLKDDKGCLRRVIGVREVES